MEAQDDHITQTSTGWAGLETNIASDNHNSCCIAIHNKLNPSLQ